MRTTTRTFLAAFAVVLLLWPSTGHAATPGSGTLSKPRQTLSWTGILAAPTADVGCAGPDLCDHFKLKVNMGEGATVRIVLPLPNPAMDIDLYVYNPRGVQVAESTGFIAENEALTFVHKAQFRNKAYDVTVVPYIVPPGTSYKATASVRRYVK